MIDKKVIACVVQGNYRPKLPQILSHLVENFDIVILSTWIDDLFILKDIPKTVICEFSVKPIVPGYSNRNLQRLSTARGITKARQLGADFVLKWRTDMLATRLDVQLLFDQSITNIPVGVNSRIVSCAYRNITIIEDWYSSIPDLFSFGHIDIMSMLWCDSDFNYEKSMNPPFEMLQEYGEDNFEWDGQTWCAESELYAIFKSRLQKYLGLHLSHELIAKNFFYLINDETLRIVWFDANGGFRPIKQAYEHEWWTESIWKGHAPVKYVKKGYLVQGIQQHFRGKVGFLKKFLEKKAQSRAYEEFNDKHSPKENDFKDS